MRGLGIFLLIIAIQAVAAIIQHRKKAKERKAREEAAQRRTMQPMGGPANQTATIGAPPQQPQSQSAASGDLEERRRSQLEQLRQRREGKRAGVAIPQQAGRQQPSTLRQGVALPSPISQRGRAPITMAPTIGTSDQSRSMAQDAARRARDAERERREHIGRMAAQMQEAEESAAHKTYERTFHTIAGEADAAAHGVKRSKSPTAVVASLAATGASGTAGARAATDRTGAAAAVLAGRLRDPANLRQVILLREILDAPLSLRQQSATS